MTEGQVDMMVRFKATVMAGVLALGACGKKDPTPPPTTAAPTTAAPTTAAPTTAAPTTAAEADATVAPTPTEDVAKAPEAPTEACTVFGKLAVDQVTIADDRATVTACGELDGAGWCFEVALADGKIAARKLGADDLSYVPNVPSPIEDPFRVKDGAPVLQLCRDATTGCKDVYTGQVLAATLTADGNTFVLMTLDDKEKVVRVFDAATLSETIKHTVQKDVDLPDCSFAASLGGALLVATGPCGGGSAGRKAWLVDPATGNKLADVGGTSGGDFDVRLGGFVHVEGDRWALRDASGKRVVVQDVKTGEVTATADLSAIPAKDVPAWLATGGDPARLIVVENRPTPGATLFIDPATGKIERQVAPDACATP